MQRSNSALWGIIAFLITVGAFVVAWKFIIPNYQENKKEVAQLDQDIKYAKIKLDSLNTTKRSFDQLGDTVSKILVAVPGDKDAPNLISELEAIASTYSLIIPSIQIGDTTQSALSATGVASTTNNKVGISFAVSGTFENLNQLIGALESDIRFMNVDSVALTSVSNDTETSDNLSMTVQLTAYKFIDTSLSNTFTTPGSVAN